MAWFPEFETPEYQAHLEEKIRREAESWNQHCEERIEFQVDPGKKKTHKNVSTKNSVLQFYHTFSY
jgi:hypothetical protein